MSFESVSTPHPDDTIVALSSSPGAGRRAIVRVSGPKTRNVINAVFHPNGPREISARQLVAGSVHLSGVSSPLPADLYFFPGPRSYTGQDLAELHTLGSPPLVERLIADVLSAGARSARPGEFTLRAFLAGKKDLPQAEAVQAVVEAGTDAELTHALMQLAGGLTQPLHALREDLLNLLADVEAALDFADEDIEFVSKPDTLTRIAAALAQLTNLQRQLDSRTVSGRTIRVVFAGAPNAGKSSLFNALSGRTAALVSPEAGTTRDYLTCSITLNGITVELIDTAGWQPADDTIAAQAQQLGQDQATRAEILLWCDEHGNFAHPVDARWKASVTEVICVHTKRDRVCSAVVCGERNPPDAPTSCSPIPTSITTPGGIDALRTTLAERVAALTRPPLAPSQSRCRHHVEVCVRSLREAHRQVLLDDPAELVALSLRLALDQLGEMTGAIYTNDLLDRIFSRFCIGK